MAARGPGGLSAWDGFLAVQKGSLFRVRPDKGPRTCSPRRALGPTLQRAVNEDLRFFQHGHTKSVYIETRSAMKCQVTTQWTTGNITKQKERVLQSQCANQVIESHVEIFMDTPKI
jgi:hypothetical protein